MTIVEELDEINDAIDTGGTVVLFFWREEQPDASQLFNQIKRTCRRFPPVQAYGICLDEIPMAASRFNIFISPAVVIYVHGRQRLKQVHGVYPEQLHDYLKALYTR